MKKQYTKLFLCTVLSLLTIVILSACPALGFMTGTLVIKNQTSNEVKFTITVTSGSEVTFDGEKLKQGESKDYTFAANSTKDFELSWYDLTSHRIFDIIAERTDGENLIAHTGKETKTQKAEALFIRPSVGNNEKETIIKILSGSSSNDFQR